MKVLNFGSLNIDKVYAVPHIVVPGETISSTGYSQGAGGKGANQSTAMAKAGLNVFHAGKIGSDGLWLIDTLSSYGVDTSLIMRDGSVTGQAIIQVAADGQNSIVLFPGANHEITTNEIDDVLSHFGSGDLLVLQNEILNLGYVIEEAKKREMMVCFNAAPYGDNVHALPLCKLDFLVVNEIEGAGIAGLMPGGEFPVLARHLARLYPQTEIVLTVGAAGAYYAFRDELFHAPIIDAPVVDTTGAGDTFLGYFLASRLKGMDMSQSLHMASVASALSVSRAGAGVSIPYAWEVFG
ncbi:ribokinase [Parasphaerochaeta coccoides]|uniref:Ribokinase n=1 Tax=Parasphaerochaeta coccoides (strain ATCC BAA-1237 / DSM 17374 / SPN1) TaxID=760011 RepID=F4GLS0_PARC1|nr:ribokinase [Parasphaerochaeta coccoides]AEC02464.1 Ribokinase [Parasphaerochaeta coccoides DSM 17374]